MIAALKNTPGPLSRKRISLLGGKEASGINTCSFFSSASAASHGKKISRDMKKELKKKT
jgi:hypothetical protein